MEEPCLKTLVIHLKPIDKIQNKPVAEQKKKVHQPFDFVLQSLIIESPILSPNT